MKSRRILGSTVALFGATLILALFVGQARAATSSEDCSTGMDSPMGNVGLVAGSSEPFGGSALRRFSIEIEDGLGLDESCVAAVVEGVLGDPRSWIHERDLGWQRVDSNPDLRIIFASPALTDAMCAPLNTAGIYSCRNGNRVILNVYRWRSGTAEYQSDLDEYRRYQINHEVGHYLGHGHTSCPSSGSLAPVMMQQTKSLGGCAMNGWPFPEVTVTPVVWDGTFWDDDTSVFEEDIEWVAERAITVGCNPPDNNRYCPDAPVLRGEMAAFLDRALALESTETDFFDDDDGSLFESSINRLAASGITRGCGDGVGFCAESYVSRAQMAAFLHRALPDAPLGESSAFVDTADSIFSDDIDWLVRAGITRGCNPPENDAFCPDALVTRGQMAAFLRRALQAVEA